MNVLVPWVLGLGAAALLGLVALHLIARDVPPPWAFPTARFIPPGRTDVRSRAVAPRDPWLLLVRALAIAALGLAAAQPLLVWGRRAEARVIVADLSRATADRGAVAARVAERWREGDRVIVLDTIAQVVPRDSVAAMAARPLPPTRAAHLSAALLLAQEAARTLRREADAVLLVLISPFARESFDAAVPLVRARWNGSVALVDVPARAPAETVRTVSMDGPPDDPLRVALAMAGWQVAPEAPVRIARRAETGASPMQPPASPPADSRETTDGVAPGGARVVVRWPGASMSRDTVTGIVVDGAALVAPLLRTQREPLTGRPVAWFPDGTVAAAERVDGAACVRDVRVAVPATGDIVLAPRFALIVDRLLAPCGAPVDHAPITAAQRTQLVAATTAPVVSIRDGADPRLIRWLLLAAAGFLLLELPLRRTRRVA